MMIVTQILNYFQPKGTRKLIQVVTQATKVPLYGAAVVLSNGSGAKQNVPFTMTATLRSQYYVVGQMIKPKFTNQVVCNIVVDSGTLALQTPLKTACVEN